MSGRRLVWYLFPAFLAVTVVALLSVTVYAVNALEDFYYSQVGSSLRSETQLLIPQMKTLLEGNQQERMNEVCNEYGPKAGVRITVIRPTGLVMADSEKDPAQMDNHADRPEIRKALDGHIGSKRRYSATLEQRMMYVAAPVMKEGDLIGVVRVSVPLQSLQHALQNFQSKIALAGILVFFLAAGVSLFLARRIASPLEKIKSAAEKFAQGELDHKVRVTGATEIDSVAQSLNEMAAELRNKIGILERRNGEQRAVLASMQEGVIAVDATGNVLTMNRAAGRLLGVDPRQARGRSMEEAVRDTTIQSFVSKTIEADEGHPIERGLALEGEEELLLQARGTALHDGNGNEMGALIVLNDVTRLRRLERIRRDFVANVSHELKTPITAIKGFVETLRDGGLEDKEQARKFLGIVADQADRLNAIIRDLMSLARIEQGDEEAEIDTERSSVRGVLMSAVRNCRVSAEEKNMEIDVECEGGLKVPMNSALVEQAVGNLVDNAIKYSEDGGRIEVEGTQTDNQAAIHVRDWGCGISREHLPRLFERFYRTDKARSRQMGGTGLGLSIVKHVARVHGGSVDVKSTVGKGSTFSIYLPMEERAAQ